MTRPLGDPNDPEVVAESAKWRREHNCQRCDGKGWLAAGATCTECHGTGLRPATSPTLAAFTESQQGADPTVATCHGPVFENEWTAKIATLTAERDRLRAEVERKHPVCEAACWQRDHYTSCMSERVDVAVDAYRGKR